MSSIAAMTARFDGAVSQFVHAVNRPPAERSRSAGLAGPGLDDEGVTATDREILDRVDDYLRAALELRRWWEAADPAGAYDESFHLERTFNRPNTSYGFFGRAPVRGALIPVMGNVQEMLYDQPRLPQLQAPGALQWIRHQLREFVLRYFMRISDFRQPEAYPEIGRAATPAPLSRLSWCPREATVREGFGFTQLYYKRRDTGRVGKFSDHESSAIVDLRELGSTYDWIVVKVRIFDFKFTTRPAGDEGPELVFGLNEESYLVLTRDFIVDRDDPAPERLGSYGFGYAFIKNPTTGTIAYGPGEFDAAFELIRFDILKTGEIRVRMTFVANRPSSIATVEIDPVGWGLWLVDALSMGTVSPLLAPVRRALRALPFSSLGRFDPVYTYVDLANAISGGAAGAQLCISRDQLDRMFLVQHFMQHYQTVVGSLLTWRQIPDWLNTAGLPDWVLTGMSS